MLVDDIKELGFVESDRTKDLIEYEKKEKHSYITILLFFSGTKSISFLKRDKNNLLIETGDNTYFDITDNRFIAKVKQVIRYYKMLKRRFK